MRENIGKVEVSASYFTIEDFSGKDWSKFKKVVLEMDEGGVAFFLGDLRRAGMEVLVYSEATPVEVDAAFSIEDYDPVVGTFYIQKEVLQGLFDESILEMMEAEGYKWPESLVRLHESVGKSGV